MIIFTYFSRVWIILSFIFIFDQAGTSYQALWFPKFWGGNLEFFILFISELPGLLIFGVTIFAGWGLKSLGTPDLDYFSLNNKIRVKVNC